MAKAEAWALLLAAALLAPVAVAADGFQAGSLTLTGTISLESEASALFFVLREADAVSWSLTAEGGALEREYLVEAALDNPLNPSNYLYSHELDSGTERRDLGPVTLTSTEGQVGGALLAQGELASTATSDEIVLVKAVTDPTVAQFGEADVSSGEGVGIEETLQGELLDLEVGRGRATLRGDMVVTLFGPWYALQEGDVSSDQRTGEFESMRNGPATQVHQETHTFTLVDAVLEVTFAQPVDLFATFATVDVVGTIDAADGDGDTPQGGAPDALRARDGPTVLQLTTASGLVVASGPDASVATGAAVAAPRLPSMVAAGAAVLALAGLAAVVFARRRRDDDLELALLAMEERRWHDALPRLTRVARLRPDDAGVHVDRALCLEQVGRLEDAAKAFETALRAAPRHAEAHFYYARTLAKMQEREAARVHLETALERDPRLVELMQREQALRGL